MIWLVRKSVAAIFILLLMVLGVVIWVFWQHYFLPPKDLMRDFKDIDFYVNEFLVEKGFNDDSIIKQYQKEIKRGGYLWIKSYKEISCDKDLLKKGFALPLQNKLSKIKGSFVLMEHKGGNLLLEVGRDERIYHNLLFIAVSSQNIKKKVITKSRLSSMILAIQQS
ncbi:MAG: hypothetical protein ABII27_02290 [bacterium]